MVTARLNAAGFSTSTLDEVLQFGCAKSSYVDQITTMMIDGLGPLRTLRKIGFTGRGKTVSLDFFAELNLSYQFYAELDR